MLHRAVLGSLERFIGILLENFAGALPPWLHFRQAEIIPVAPAFNDYAQKAADALSAKGYRVEADLGDGRMNAKIRAAQGLKIPYMLVCGQKELDDGTVSVRMRDGKQLPAMKLDAFADYLADKVRTRALDL
jgi:threonyl-tRNA synthetase